MKETIEQRVVGLFVLMLAILAYVAWSSVHNIKENIKSNDWVNHTHDVIIHAGEILSYLHAGDAGLRTYLITGDERDKQSYQNAYSTMDQGYRGAYSKMVEILVQAKALTRSGAEEEPLRPRFLELQTLISNRIDVARAIVKAREQGGLEAVRQQFKTHPDVESIFKIEKSVNNIIEIENGLLRERDEQQHLQAQATKMMVYTGLGVNFVLLALAVWLLRDDLAARRQAAEALEEANAHLEAKVQERTAELVKTNQSLKQENLERRWSYQALDHQLRYNQLIINSIAEMVFVISRALNISRVNPAVVQLTGWEPQELISQSIERVLQLPPDPAGGASQNPLTAAMRDGRQLQDRPANLLARSGKIIAVHYTLIPLHDQDKIVGGVVTVRVQNPVQQQSQS
jgi:PAS domain S-box-containing protein